MSESISIASPPSAINRILVCHDGSAQADRALKQAGAIAHGCGAQITLLGIAEETNASKPLLETLQKGQAFLEEKKISCEVVSQVGKPLQEIVRRTQENHFELVVIGAVHKEIRGAFWVSSKSYKIMKEIEPPVLSVAGNASPLKKVLVCSGGKRYIEPALRLTGTIAASQQAEVTLLHVLPELPAMYSNLPRMGLEVERIINSGSELGTNLRAGREILTEYGVKVEIVLRQGAVLETILNEIYYGHYEMVVTGSLPHRKLRTYVLGDITREIVNRTRCSVLVVRSHQPSAAQKFSLKNLFGRLVGSRAVF